MRDLQHMGRGFGRAPLLDRRRLFCLVAGLLVVGLLTDPQPAHGQSDALPTAWHEAAGLTPLLTAPPPSNPATICIIDTGVTPTPDLTITNRWAYDGGTLDDVRATEDSPGHGTVVAHFAAAAVNGWGSAGAFPHARITSVRVFPREGGASWHEYIAAITRCPKLDPNTKVIVISIGGPTISAGEAEELEDQIERARDRQGVNVVASAGNGGSEPDFPARFPATFAVAAARAGRLCDFSGRGVAVDVAAPGCGVSQAGRDGTLWSLDGTSFAAPIVAGLLAALRSYAPSMGAQEAESIVTSSARSGVIDARVALAAGLGWTAERPPTPTDPPAASLPSPASPIAPPVGPLERVGSRLPRPAVRVARRSRRVVFRALNRPRSVRFEVRVGGRRLERQGARLVLRTAMRRARCRFVTEWGQSPWAIVRW